MKMLAKTMKGLEGVLSEEIAFLGGKNIKNLTRAVSFEGDRELMYKANIHLRTALRILLPKKEFIAKNEHQLYDVIFNIPWESIMTLRDTFSIDTTVNSEIFTHSKYVALKSKDAIVDRFYKKFGKRPNVNILNPTYRIEIHVRGDKFTLSLDSSGDSLHKRGYRINTVEAPLNEVMAAGIILLSDWRRDTPLIDPMCGSGTILIEAARIAKNIPPQQKSRDFGFKKWRSFDEKLYDKVWEEAMDLVVDRPVDISGGDKSLRSVKVTCQNLEEAGLSAEVTVEKKDFFKSEGREGVTLMTNPPYDIRLKQEDIGTFYHKIGNHSKNYYKDSILWVFSGNPDALVHIDLQEFRSFDLLNGKIDSKLIGYETPE